MTNGSDAGSSKEVAMRKVVAVEFVSLDGVMESPEEWAFSYTNDEMEEVNASGMAASDAMLLGRVTYERMAHDLGWVRRLSGELQG